MPSSVTWKRTRSYAAVAALALGGFGLVGTVTAASVVATAQPALADGPGVGTPYVVSVGDSYISGEAGRWAGNTNKGESYHDALGNSAYWDNATNTAESINRCHRSKSAEVFIGDGLLGKTLSCSGAKTATAWDGDNFKPGLDFWTDGVNKGQALALKEFAQTRNVKVVAVSIGGNDFNFGSIVQTCVSNWASSPTWAKNYCHDDSSVTANFTSANVTAKTTAIKNALLNVSSAMTQAGYSATQYTILVQNYMSPLPLSSGFRYAESGYTRQNTGGCGFWNADANWANNSALPTINSAVTNALSQSGITNARTLDLATAFNGRRLCENTVGLLEEKSLATWQSTGAVDKTEWINTIRTVTACCGNYYIQESLHPNYWGQLALRSCVRLAYNGGAPRSGRCTILGTGKNAQGEPRMQLL
ncbi:MAG TPA: hypothetical protein VNA14_07125 [Mycobacteriales bacterium]|nr:hypothetical protein [Mycobacteriales bacterium]